MLASTPAVESALVVVVDDQITGRKILEQLILGIGEGLEVAAFGDAHIQVSKSTDTDVQLTLNQLDKTEIIEEIARMIGGEKTAEVTLEHARSLYNQSQLN